MNDLKRVMVVEDSATQALHLKAILESLGYDVKVASNGRVALDMLHEDFCRIVITDWIMPEMDGIEFCKSLRSLDLPGYVYVLILTARDNLDDLVEGLEAGADDYLTKPVNPAELAARLKTAKRILELESSLRQRNEEIARMAVTDQLTGLYNRRYFNEQLPLVIKAAVRFQQPLSLIMMDIDHFKSVNDTYGHQAGDAVLQKFAEMVRSSLRAGVDWAARFGGEEFAVVMTNTALKGAEVAAERLRLLVAHSLIPIPSGDKLRITASFGVASVTPGSPDEPTMEKLVAAADEALYRAKRRGRNRVVAVVL
ncbi:diguanylate cyclase [Thermodesulforhabdus norvegica]|uniref:diguanylate cyclase n=1 Tax=Thermodesulforhabdus norvegica TaxID=39841 RepID=A0A1I4UUN0_9BACT|nr:diguanylate cyclase [Thermodesulforhabdus norvegica]SFM92689.1 response regulator receiver modulated diguanylate cyclase [Thermodesulforhabdus norvegica]